MSKNADVKQIKKLSVVVPAYNEEANLPRIIPQVFESLENLKNKFGLDYEVVVINDGSKDRTEQVVLRLQKKYKKIKYVFQENQGKTGAVKHGVQLASGDVILIQDADLEYDPMDYEQLLSPFFDTRTNTSANTNTKTKIVYGNRFGKKENKWLVHSFVANKVLTWLTNLLSRLKIKDMETCYKVFKADIAKDVYNKVEAPRFGLEPEVTMRLGLQGYKIQNIPISYNARSEEQGKKININDFFEAIWTLISLKVFKRYVKMPIPVDFVTYTVIGGVAVLSDIVVFWLLFTWLANPYVNLVSYTVGTIVSFSLNAKFNFNVNDKLASRYVRFWLVSIFGAFWSSWLIDLLIKRFAFKALVAKVLSLPLVLVYQYILSKKFVYSKK